MTNDKQLGKIIFGFAVIIWLAVVFALYYVGHKPFTPVIASALIRSAGYLLAALALIAVGGGLGRRILPAITTSPLEDLALQASLGFGLLSWIFLFIGWLIGLSTGIAWITLLLAVLLVGKQTLGWLHLWQGLGLVWKTAGGFGKSIAVLTVLILGFTLSIALAPPLKYDSLSYHLVMPYAHILAGKIDYIPSNILWGMPQLGETLYTWGMLVTGGARALPVATCLSWGAGLIALVGLLGSGLRIFGSAGWVAVASLLASNTVALELEWGYAEWFTILYGWGFLVAMERWFEGRSNLWLLIAGAYAGFALSSKYPAGALVLAGVLIIGWVIWRDKVLKKGLFEIGGFLLAAAAAALPWLLKNWFATGNPFYPTLFPAGEVDSYRLGLYQNLPTWGDWRDAFLLPWMATIWGYEGAPGYGVAIGPLLLGLAAIYPFGWGLRKNKTMPSARVAAPVALIGLLVWIAAARLSGYLTQTRLYMAFLPSFALLAAGGFFILERVELGKVRLRRVAGSLVLLALGLNALQVGIDSVTRNPGATLIGVQPTEAYLTNNLGWYSHAMNAIMDLPGNPKVLMLWEPRSLYCLPRCDPDEVIDRWLSDYRQYDSPDAILKSWRDAGYTHLLFNRSGAEYVRGDDALFTPAHWQALDRLLEELPPPTNSGDAYSLYTLAP